MYKDIEKRRTYDRAWYRKNRSKHTNWKKSRRVSLKAWFRELKSTLTCENCGESHPACLQFHHKIKDNKIGDVSSMLLRGYSKSKILEEIGKCVCLCANCHAKVHWDSNH